MSCLACAAACATPVWAPRLKSLALKTVCLPLPHAFIDYLLEDGVRLPQLPAGLPTHVTDPRLRNHGEESDALGCDAVDSDAEDAESATPPPRSFEALETAIADAIARLGGSVFVALDWSSPQDAAWITETRSVKCSCAGEVFLLLKSSDHVQRDLELGQLLADASPAATTAAAGDDCGSPTASTPPDPRTHFAHHLVLKPWYALPLAGIFRCFAWEGRLLAVSQRHTDHYFEFLVGARVAAVCDAVSEFFSRKLQGGPPVLPLRTVVFDVYVDEHRVRLIGLAPFGPGAGEHSTDPCLFTWEEIAELAGAGAASALACEHRPGGSSPGGGAAVGSSGEGAAPPLAAPVIRVVESAALRFSRNAVYGFPDDLLEAAARGLPGGGSAADLAAEAAARASDPAGDSSSEGEGET